MDSMRSRKRWLSRICLLLCCLLMTASVHFACTAAESYSNNHLMESVQNQTAFLLKGDSMVLNEIPALLVSHSNHSVSIRNSQFRYLLKYHIYHLISVILPEPHENTQKQLMLRAASGMDCVKAIIRYIHQMDGGKD